MSVSSVVELSLDELKDKLARKEVVVVDVREPHEFAAGHIPGAALMPLSQFDPASLPAEAGKTIVFSCRTGVRSLRAIEMARLAGLNLDTHYKGGFQEWASMGEPVETGSD